MLENNFTMLKGLLKWSPILTGGANDFFEVRKTLKEIFNKEPMEGKKKNNLSSIESYFSMITKNLKNVKN